MKHEPHLISRESEKKRMQREFEGGLVCTSTSISRPALLLLLLVKGKKGNTNTRRYLVKW